MASIPQPLPTSFLSLPAVTADGSLPSDVIQAHQALDKLFESARNALNLDESDQIRLKYYLHKVDTVAKPIVIGLQSNNRSDIPHDYVVAVTTLISLLEHHLQNALASSQARLVGICFLLQDPLNYCV
jgi:hypothetical protein